MVWGRGMTQCKGAKEHCLHHVIGSQRQQPNPWRGWLTQRSPREDGNRLKGQPPYLVSPHCRARLQPFASLGERRTISREVLATRIWESGTLSPAF